MSKLFSRKIHVLKINWQMSFLVFFFHQPRLFVELKKYRVHNAALEYIAHNIFHLWKLFYIFIFPSNIFLFSRENFFHDTYSYSRKHSSTLEHIKIYLFLPLRGMWGSLGLCVWTMCMDVWMCITICLYAYSFLHDSSFQSCHGFPIFQTLLLNHPCTQLEVSKWTDASREKF